MFGGIYLLCIFALVINNYYYKSKCKDNKFMLMKVQTKIKVKATLQGLGVGDKVSIKMDSVSEIALRVAASRIKKESGAVYKIERDYPSFKVTRTA